MLWNKPNIPHSQYLIKIASKNFILSISIAGVIKTIIENNQDKKAKGKSYDFPLAFFIKVYFYKEFILFHNVNYIISFYLFQYS